MVSPFFSRHDFAATSPLFTLAGCCMTAYTAAETPIPLASLKARNSTDSIGSSALAKLLGAETWHGRLRSYFSHFL